MPSTILRAAAASVLLAAATPCLAQEAMYTNAATMPSPGVFVVRPQFMYAKYGFDPSENTSRTERFVADTSVQFGLVRDLSLTLDIPVEFETVRDAATGSDDHRSGVSDLDLTLKYRFYKDDSGGIDTLRIAALVGAHFASGDGPDFSSESFNPHLGAVLTLVRGRHGFNQELSYTFNTGSNDRANVGGGNGSADAFRYNTAYLFRLAPDQYTSATTGAWYATIELNGLYETNGDNEIRWSPGIMFEHRDFALEFMAQLPLTNNLRHRAEMDFSVGIGVRLTF